MPFSPGFKGISDTSWTSSHILSAHLLFQLLLQQQAVLRNNPTGVLSQVDHKFIILSSLSFSDNLSGYLQESA